MSVKSDVRSRLEAAGASPAKAYGQHFLIEAPILDAIAAEALQTGEPLLEVGPGPGTLTERLIAGDRSVVAVEKDRRLAGWLTQWFAANPRVRIVEGDVLQQSWGELVPTGPATAVGNLPYNISGPLIARFVEDRSRWSHLFFMLQEEVADRLAAPAGSRIYGPLSVLLQACGPVKKLRRVPPGAFWPPPKVWSAVIEVRLEHPNAVGPPHWDRFRDWVRTAFRQRRKTLRNALAAVTDPTRLRRAARRSEVDLSQRPESLSWQAFRALVRAHDEDAPASGTDLRTAEEPPGAS